jgi:DeoR/GlpR family transcriptional regulator of sugar metabolism
LALPDDHYVSDVTELTPALAATYATVTSRTVSRDLNAIQASGLVERTNEGVRARTEIMNAFLPLRAVP